MGARVPGPLCSARLGDGWIDAGTLCRTQSSAPGPTDLEMLGSIVWKSLDPSKAKFDRDHVYSLAPEAARKRDIDLQIIGDDYGRSAEISLDNERYLKELIRLGSGGKQTVSTRAGKIQFFIVRGGAEGFLPAHLAKKDAGDFLGPRSSPSARQFRWDHNDLLAVFDARGKLIRAARLQRPISITGKWREETSTKIYNAWHNKGVSIYRNTNPGWVPYLGLTVDEGKKDLGWVDIHKQEQTNGCIFIVDPNTPKLGDEALDLFEPQLIVDVLASIGKRPDQVKGAIWLGVMRVVDLKALK
jgi:hypothetical protein